VGQRNEGMKDVLKVICGVFCVRRIDLINMILLLAGAAPPPPIILIDCREMGSYPTSLFMCGIGSVLASRQPAVPCWFSVYTTIC